MANQIIEARKGNITDEMKYVSKVENINPELLKESIALGKTVILKNNYRTSSIPTAIGECVKVKINANTGLSDNLSAMQDELDKARVIEHIQADVFTDMQNANLIDETRQAILSSIKLPVCLSPLKQTYKELKNEKKPLKDLSKDEIISNIEKSSKDGVDLISIPCGITKNTLKQLKEQNGILKTVFDKDYSIANWMNETEYENPYYENFDEILEIAKISDTTLLLSSDLNTQYIKDSFNRFQVMEMAVIGELARKANNLGIQTIIEYCGHATIDKIPYIVQTIKNLTNNTPLYVSELISYDCAIGYDNITSAIASSIAALNGANMISSVSPNDYLSKPNTAQITQGIISAKIAAQSADLAKGNEDILIKNYKISKAKINSNKKAVIECLIDKSIYKK